MIAEEVLQEIKRNAENFRELLESCSASELPTCLKEFPAGSCGDASLLLAEHLRSKEIEHIVYVRGERTGENWCTHAWLEIDDVIVDLTADQFDGISERVLVTRERSWHNQFKVVARYAPNLLSEDPAIGELRRFSAWFQKKINN